jgi:hypothetical protein
MTTPARVPTASSDVPPESATAELGGPLDDVTGTPDDVDPDAVRADDELAEELRAGRVPAADNPTDAGLNSMLDGWIDDVREGT